MSFISSTDQLGNTIDLHFPPQRIISLVPSQTELLFDLGLSEKVKGITRFCIHPEKEAITKEKIGGTKRFDMDKIKTLQPDLIIGNKEENYPEGIEELQKSFPVWMSDIFTLDDAYAMMREVSRITGTEAKGQEIINKIKAGFASIIRQPIFMPSAAYFIWRKPYMVAASHTFINHMLGLLSIKNIFNDLARYPEVNPSLLTELKPDYIFLSSEPYAFSDKHFAEFQSFSPSSKVMVVNGEIFSWYGSRLRLAPAYINELRKSL